MNKKKIVFLMSIIITIFSYGEKINPLKKYISDEVFFEAEKKFENKDFFAIKQIKTPIKKDVKNDLHRIFIKVETIIKKDRKWGCIIFYNEISEELKLLNKRKVIIGDTVLKIEKQRYFLKPYEYGVMIREINTGQTLNLKIQEGR